MKQWFPIQVAGKIPLKTTRNPGKLMEFYHFRDSLEFYIHPSVWRQNRIVHWMYRVPRKQQGPTKLESEKELPSQSCF